MMKIFSIYLKKTENYFEQTQTVETKEQHVKTEKQVVGWLHV